MLAGGAVGSWALAACTSGKSKARHGAADFQKLESALEGKAILPSSPGYTRARELWNTRYDGVRPRAIVEAADAEDVRKVVTFARENDLRVIPRNGRHSFGGHSTGDGAVIVDVSRLTGVEVSADGTSARLGAGLDVLETYQALWPHKAAIPAGTCPTVGITGLTTGGGLGVLCRRHGLTCDALTGVEVVDANGRILHADEQENADLFWAIRGAGSGSFGVITSLTFRLVPVDMPFTRAEYEFPWSSAVEVLEVWQDWGHSAPPELASFIVMETRAPAQGAEPKIVVEVVYGGTSARLKPIVADFLGAVGTPPTHAESSTGEFVTIPSDFYCKGLRPHECRDMEVSPEGKLPRVAFYAKSDVASQPWPSAGFEMLVEWLEKRQRNPVLTPARFSETHTVGKVILEPCDGAVNAIPADATAFVHRNGRFVSQYQARWHSGASEATASANLEWTNGLYSAIAPYRSGFAYQDYIDPELPDWEHAYYGANLPRLRRIKSRYDPDDFFRFEQSIRPG